MCECVHNIHSTVNIHRPYETKSSLTLDPFCIDPFCIESQIYPKLRESAPLSSREHNARESCAFIRVRLSIVHYGMLQLALLCFTTRVPDRTSHSQGSTTLAKNTHKQACTQGWTHSLTHSHTHTKPADHLHRYRERKREGRERERAKREGGEKDRQRGRPTDTCTKTNRWLASDVERLEQIYIYSVSGTVCLHYEAHPTVLLARSAQWPSTTPTVFKVNIESGI